MTRSDTANTASLNPCKRSLVNVGRYKILKVLGKGNFARVEEAVHTLLNVKVAIKVIDTGVIREDYVIKNLTREAKLLSKLRHPSIVRLYETIQCGPVYYLVIELATGGDLYTHIKNQPLGRLDEKTAKGYGRQLVAALEHMHSRGIVHRDLKMENIMLQDARKEQIKIVDFGLSNIYTRDNPLKTHCGSPEYAAPELFVVGKRYGPEVDLWSLGVVFYAMATGRLPFQSPRDNQTSSEERRRKLLAQINRGLTAAQKKSIAAMSSEYRNLVNRLLMPTAHERINIHELSFHPWIVNRLKNNNKMSQSDLLAIEHDAILDEIAEATRTERTIIERDILQSKYGEMGGMYNIKAHVMRQGGSFHAFRARSWTTSSHPTCRQSQGRNAHSTTTPSSRTGYQTRASLGSLQMNSVHNSTRNASSTTVQKRAMMFHRSSLPAKPSSSGSPTKCRWATWTPKESRICNFSYSSCANNQRSNDSTCPLHYDPFNSKTTPMVHRSTQLQQIDRKCGKESCESVGTFLERSATTQQQRSRIATREIRSTTSNVRPAYLRPEVMPRRDPIERWITEKLKNFDKRKVDGTFLQGDQSQHPVSETRPVQDAVEADPRDTQPRNNNRPSLAPAMVQTTSKEVRSGHPGTMGQGDRVTERCFYRSPGLQRSDLRKSRLISSNGSKIVERNIRGSRPVTAVNEGCKSPLKMAPSERPRAALRASGKLRWMENLVKSSNVSNTEYLRYKSRTSTDEGVASNKKILIEKDLQERYEHVLKGIVRDSTEPV